MTAASAAVVLGLAPPAGGAPLADQTAQQAPAPQQAPAGSSPDDGLGKADRDRLAEAERAGRPRVTMLVAAEEGRTAAAAGELESLGGIVEQTDESVGYLRVSMPTGQAERAAKVDPVAAVDIDGLIALDDPRPQGAENPTPQPAPDARTPRINPYMPTADTGAAQFALSNRRYDGRGTTVAILDSGVDLDHPALATLPTGERKIVDWYTANSPDSGDGTWVRMSAQRYSGAFTAGGRNWTAPAGGPYSFALLNEGAQDLGGAGSQIGADLDRDGVLRETFGVLQDTVSRDVFVDVDGDGDFTNNARMIDYRVRQDVGFFGTDNPATPVAERVAFVVQTDRSDYNAGGIPWVNIGIAANAHGSHVAGIAAANDLFGGRMDGAAPGARVISIKACLATNSCTGSGLIDGVLYAARNGADVVNISIGGLPALNDGNNARSELYNRIIAEYNMQLFISAGNSGAGANTVGDPSVSTDAVSVASSITDDTWLSNYGSVANSPEGLHPFSSRGPREDGGFKPQLAAPGSAISSTPRWQPGGPVAGVYGLEPGYSMFNGTSMAAPQTTGAAALLVGAYKATHAGQRPPVAALRTAMVSGARYISTLGAYEQGAGIVDVAAAWRLLEQGVNTDTITTSVPVNTLLADQLAIPGVGVGIHDREGVARNYTREYTLTRTTGPDTNRLYRLSWLGNDGTFATRPQVRLPLNEPVTVPVRIRPTGPGAHSAVLRIDSADTVGVDAQTMNVVFSPAEFTRRDGYVATFDGTVGRNQTRSYFVRVPEGASALQIDMQGGGAEPGTGQLRFLRFTPFGVPLDSTSSLNCFNPDAGGGCVGGTPTSRTVTDPVPGVWEIVVESRRTSDAQVAPFTMSATLLGAQITPNPDVIESATVGTPVERSYTVDNAFAEFTGRVVGGPLGSASIQRPEIADLEQQQYEVTVPAGATALTATIGNPSDAGADLDLVVFNCTSGTCVQAGISAGGSSEERVTVANPAAGAWVVLVDGFAVPAGTTEYDYRDVVSSPAFGSLDVADADALRESGRSWTVPGTLTPAAAPGEGRQLLGSVGVVTAGGVRVASGDVIVQSVTG